MLNQLEEIERRVIPRWRPFAQTPNPELSLTSNNGERLQSNSIVPDAEAKWQKNPSLENASELVSAASLFGRTENSRKAANELLNSDEILPALHRLSKHHLANREETPFSPPTIQSLEEIRDRLKVIRNILVEYPRNTILQVEAARLYAILGQVNSANHCFEKALAAKEGNRFIIRSATRFFVHGQDPERAYSLLRDIPSTDPWLLAAAISCADLVGKRDFRIRNASQLLDKFPADQVTELAAALATIEMKDGSIKKAKRLFARSAISPNDNSVAQIRWAGKGLHIAFDESLLRVQRTFEARFQHAMHERAWRDAVEHASLWMQDEPYSVRPAAAGCYVAAEFLQDWNSCKNFALRGLQANPNDVGLLNNLALAEAALGNFANAQLMLEKARNNASDPSNSVILTSTKGFLSYRQGDTISGAKYYEEANTLAKMQKDIDLIQRSALHWMHEEMNLGNVPDQETWTRLLKMTSNSKQISQSASGFFDAVLHPLWTKQSNLPTNELQIPKAFSPSLLVPPA